MTLAKPSGVRLEQHTANVRKEAATILESRPFFVQKYARFCERDLAQNLDLIAFWHDAGKAHPKWQNACQLDYEQWQKTGKVGPHLMRSGVRHEMESLRLAHENRVTLGRIGKIAIAAHHRKLGEKFDARWKTDDCGKFAPFWKEFKSWSSDLRSDDAQSFDAAILDRYKYDGPRALLQLADGRASGKEDNRGSPDLVDFEYDFPHKDKQTGLPNYRGVQKLIQEIWDEPFAILRAPTGGGKTDACLLWAKHQIEAKRADRLVIAMPTRFTSNSLSVAVTQTLSQTGLYHSSAWQGYPDKFRDAQLRMARELLPPVTVTTLDHLCIALTGAREDHHAIFWNLAHSCVVIDESDFYDDFTQRNMLVLLRALKILEVPVLVMSATVPESARELYALSGFKSEKIYDSTEGKERIRCHLETRGTVEKPEDIADLLVQAIQGEPTIIYCNTVQRAQEFYRYLLDNGAGKDDVVLYHSRFIEGDKIKIEARLSYMLGPDAWKESRAHGIAVLTQIGELSVNISANTMISELCPIDRLAQRVGRLARFPDKNGEYHPGQVFLIEPHREDKNGELHFYPAPYGSYVKREWQMTPALENSRLKLVTGDYSAADFVRLVDELYPVAQAPERRAQDNRELLEKLFIQNRFIIPFAQLNEDDEDFQSGERWASRDVPPQKTIYFVDDNGIRDNTPHPFEQIYGWNDWREWTQNHALTLYVYQWNNAQRNRQIEEKTVVIGEDKETIWVVDSRHYNSREGLDFGRQKTNEDEWNPHDEE
ncbi:MAG TPA: CRISPR-associated helicase Cas3' [Abditibacterium sp.]|jgi:CRISPR-associated endonuclease/helicase Cas3